MFKKIVLKLFFLIAAIFLIPLAPIMVIFLGMRSPEYVIKGTLNPSILESGADKYWNVYTEFLKKILSFNFGNSLSSGQPVIKEAISGLSESFKVIAPALAASVILGFAIGLLAERYKIFGLFWEKIQILFYIPMIAASYILLYFLDFLRVDFFSGLKYMFAALVLSLYPIYVIAKSLKNALKNFYESDFFLFHQACGFDIVQIWKKFCSRLILADFFSFFENIIIFMVGFIFFVEAPFGIRGMGYKFILASRRFDYPVIIGFSIFSIILLSIINSIIEIAKIFLDPRKANI